MEFELESEIGCSAAEAWDWHCRPRTLARLIPPWERVEILSQDSYANAGARVLLRVRLGSFRFRWLAGRVNIRPGLSFTDIQVRGPFRSWSHEHHFEDSGSGHCRIRDRLEFEPPLGTLGRFLSGRILEKRMARAFAWRHRVTASDLLDHRLSPLQQPLAVAVSGSGGLLGSALVDFLASGGHPVKRLVRARPATVPDSILWEPESGEIDRAGLAGLDAVVHLAGVSIASGRWSAGRMRSILESRVRGARLIAETLAGMADPPRVLVCASAVGFYGDRGEELLDEASPPGSGFLPEVCSQWEAACAPAVQAGIRVVNLRFGMVLTPAGGALRRLLPAFRFGLGGPFGSGRQYVSWIAIDDAVRAVYHALGSSSLVGPVNVVAPEPVHAEEFSRRLAMLLGRPAVLRVPAFALRACLGRMAEELLLSGQRVQPSKLESSGFRFRYPGLSLALAHLTGNLPVTHILT